MPARNRIALEPRGLWRAAARHPVVYLSDGMTGTAAPEGYAWLGVRIE